jgi:hypothetical protein
VLRLDLEFVHVQSSFVFFFLFNETAGKPLTVQVEVKICCSFPDDALRRRVAITTAAHDEQGDFETAEY